MIEIYPNLYVGNETDYYNLPKNQRGWRIVQAAKEPFHRDALGYGEGEAPRGHPDYLVARRDHRLILNLTDALDPKDIPKKIIDAALSFIDQSLNSGFRVLAHCNMGISRSPGIGLLYLASRTDRLPRESFFEAEEAFRQIYPPYNPGSGIRGFLIENWNEYLKGQG